ncbi:hypothetical protein GYMLUDRAFT_34107 [Collybiopsis luxurians FD-317 M1]|nr:hypothetical protein GYMLUDRAFT_34107 [Collybiopsis luxurians FD-317 M1]
MFWTRTACSVKAQITSQPFKRSQFGLFQGKTKLYGNNVPHSKHKTRRTWLPNVHRKRLFSEALGNNVRVKATTRALKTIKKHKGVDNYVLNMPSETLGWEGMRIRQMVRDALKSPRTAVSEEEDLSTRVMKEFEKLKVNEAAEARGKEISRIVRNDLPDLGTARRTTEKALEVLGPSASPRRVLKYMKEQQKEYKELLGVERYTNFI